MMSMRFRKLQKLSSGWIKTTEVLSELYGLVTNVYKAKDIKTAEAAKVIENIQRDLNIALMNELSMIFEKMGLKTSDVLDAADTKWNFYRYTPGLIGGHCIPVDPYYLVHKAEELGHHPQVILAGRAINDNMPKHVALMTVKALNETSKVIKGSKVLIMGLTYKENVRDTRVSPVRGLVKELKEFGVEVLGYDPFLEKDEVESFGVNALLDLDVNVDCVVVTVCHDKFKEIGIVELKKMMPDKSVLVDVRGMFDEKEVLGGGLYYKVL